MLEFLVYMLIAGILSLVLGVLVESICETI